MTKGSGLILSDRGMPGWRKAKEKPRIFENRLYPPSDSMVKLKKNQSIFFT
jgi:hypothetical protein